MEAYDGPQIVGMDLHRRRSVLVRMGEDGRKLASARITSSPARLAAEIRRAGLHPKVVLEACYGWSGRRIRWRRSAPRCTWHTRWG